MRNQRRQFIAVAHRQYLERQIPQDAVGYDYYLIELGGQIDLAFVEQLGGESQGRLLPVVAHQLGFGELVVLLVIPQFTEQSGKVTLKLRRSSQPPRGVTLSRVQETVHV